ncbi:MAG: hydrogenase maturation protease [Pseudomonadota bacterium]|nr:hydrogenase maturation protease [Pseudomonadota bacterium]
MAVHECQARPFGGLCSAGIPAGSSGHAKDAGRDAGATSPARSGKDYKFMRHLIGFGNDLHGDDGFGIAVCQRMAELPLPDDVRVFAAGTRGLDALALFEGCDEAIIIDASEPAGRPGHLAFPDPETCAEDSSLPGHGAGVGYLLRALSALGTPPHLRVIAAEAAALTPFHTELSPEMQGAVEETVALLRGWLGVDGV